MVFSAFSIIFNDVKKCDNRFHPEMQWRGFLENGSFLVAICLEIVISSHFRGAIGAFRLAICAVLHKFSTVIFANLLKIMDFSKVGAKKGVPCCKHSPHRPTLVGNCHGSTQRNMYEFFMWQLPQGGAPTSYSLPLSW